MSATSAMLRAGAPAATATSTVATTPFVEFNRVWLAYNDELAHRGEFAVEDVSLRVEPGEFIAIVGPSGCGKSTFMKLATGLRPATRGVVKVAGEKVTGPLQQVGMAFQAPTLLPWRTTLDNVMLPLEIVEPYRSTLRARRDEYVARARELLRTVGLAGYEDKYPWQLSGGMQQRAAICRALVHDPKIVLMDEPFGALDALTRERMNLQLQRIHFETRKTIFLITHSIPESVFLADRVIVMTDRPGAIAAIYDVPLPRPRTLEMMGAPAFTELARQVRSHFYAQGQID